MTDLFDDDQNAEGPDDTAAGPGRKPGVPNKHDGQLGKWIATKYGRTPAQELARRAFMKADEFKTEFNCKPSQVAPRQERLLVKLLPYTEKKMPTMIEVTDEKRVLVQIGQVAAPGEVEQQATRTIELVPANVKKTKQKQTLSKSDDEKSNDARSNENS